MPRGIPKPLPASGQVIVNALIKWHTKANNPDITLEITGSDKNIKLVHKNVHVIDIVLTWSKAHFLVQFRDREGYKTQSIMRIQDEDDVKDLIKVYRILLKNRANNRSY